MNQYFCKFLPVFFVVFFFSCQTKTPFTIENFENELTIIHNFVFINFKVSQPIETVLPYFKKVERLTGAAKKMNFPTARLHFYRAALEFSVENPQGALLFCDKAIESDPYFDPAYIFKFELIKTLSKNFNDLKVLSSEISKCNPDTIISRYYEVETMGWEQNTKGALDRSELLLATVKQSHPFYKNIQQQQRYLKLILSTGRPFDSAFFYNGDRFRNEQDTFQLNSIPLLDNSNKMIRAGELGLPVVLEQLGGREDYLFAGLVTHSNYILSTYDMPLK